MSISPFVSWSQDENPDRKQWPPGGGGWLWSRTDGTKRRPLKIVASHHSLVAKNTEASITSCEIEKAKIAVAKLPNEIFHWMDSHFCTATFWDLPLTRSGRRMATILFSFTCTSNSGYTDSYYKIKVDCFHLLENINFMFKRNT